MNNRNGFLRFRCSLFSLYLLAAPAVHAQAELAIEVNPDPVRPGETMRVALTVSNTGTGTLSNVQLQMLMAPADQVFSVFESLISAGGDCPDSACFPDRSVTWTLGNLTAGTSRTVTLPLRVRNNPAPAAGTTIQIQGTVLIGGVQQDSESKNVVVDAGRALDLSVDEDRDPVQPGGLLSYRLSFGNRSSTTVVGASLRFPLPAGVTFRSASDGGVFSTGAVTWALGELVSGASGERRVTVSLSGAQSGDLLRVEAAEITGTLGGQPEESRALAVTRVQETPPFGLAVELNPDPVGRGETMLLAMTVSNRGAATLSNVQLQMRMPKENKVNPVFASLISAGGNCGGGASCLVNEFVTWTLGNLAAGTSRTVTLPLTVPGTSGPPDGSSITVETELRDGGNVVAISNASQQATRRTTATVGSGRALELSVDESQDAVAPGSPLTYTLNYGNRSSNTVLNGLLQLPVPAGASFVSASGQGVFVAAEGVVEWAIGEVLSGRGGERSVTVSADAVQAGDLLQVDAAEFSSELAGAAQKTRTLAVTRVENPPPVRVSMATSADPVARTGGFTLSLTTTNLGPSTLSNVQLQMRMPEDGELVPVSTNDISDGGNCFGRGCRPDELVTWSLGNLASQASRTVTIRPQVSNSQGRPLDGTLITVEAQAHDAGASFIDATAFATSGQSVLVGTAPLDQGTDPPPPSPPPVPPSPPPPGPPPVEAQLANPQAPIRCTGSRCRVGIECNLAPESGTRCTNRITLLVRAALARSSDAPSARAPRQIRFASGISNVSPGGTANVRLRLTGRGRDIVRRTNKRRLRGVIEIRSISGTVRSSIPTTIRLR